LDIPFGLKKFQIPANSDFCLPIKGRDMVPVDEHQACDIISMSNSQ
jgi:hypothetical protein